MKAKTLSGWMTRCLELRRCENEERHMMFQELNGSVCLVPEENFLLQMYQMSIVGKDCSTTEGWLAVVRGNDSREGGILDHHLYSA